MKKIKKYSLIITRNERMVKEQQMETCNHSLRIKGIAFNKNGGHFYWTCAVCGEVLETFIPFDKPERSTVLAGKSPEYSASLISL